MGTNLSTYSTQKAVKIFLLVSMHGDFCYSWTTYCKPRSVLTGNLLSSYVLMSKGFLSPGLELSDNCHVSPTLCMYMDLLNTKLRGTAALTLKHSGSCCAGCITLILTLAE